MILVVYNETKILNVIEAPLNGITHSGHPMFKGSVEDAEIFFQMKNFSLDLINQYKSRTF